MILETKKFQDVCKTILLAVDGATTAANLELEVKNGALYLSVTNREYYVATKFDLDAAEDFKAVVDAKLFLNLIAGLTTETFELTLSGNSVLVSAGKSSKYKTALIYENDKMMELPVIKLENTTVDMPISLDILSSILNVNGKELLKIKAIDVNELQKLYYITNEGCFTFTTGACLNSFTLDKPVQFLLNDRIVKLFKLFKEDVKFSFGHDDVNGVTQTKIVLQTPETYLAAIIANDDVLLQRVKGPYAATKNFINEKYSDNVVLSVPELKAAIARLMLFTKNSITKADMLNIPVSVEFNNEELVITDKQGNSEVLTIENGSYVDSNYKMGINLNDLRLVLDSCVCDHVTLNCGNHRSVVVTRGTVSNLIPEAIGGAK